MKEVSENALRAMLAQQTGEVFLVCLRIEHDDIPTQRLVYNTTAITRSDGEYKPCPMQLMLPDETEDQVPQVQIVVDNVDREVLRLIRTLDGVPKCTIEVVLASSPNIIEAGPFDFSLLDASYDALAITGTLGYQEDVLNQQVPAQTFTPTNSPGLFL